MKLEPKMRTDTDYGKVVAKYGVISFQSFEKLENILKQLKIYAEYTSDNLVIFKIGKTYQKEDVQELISYEAEQWERANKLVMPVNIMPALKARLKDVAVQTHEATRKLDAPSRASFGDEMDRVASKMLEDFLVMANGWIDKDKFLTDTMRNLQVLNAKLMVATELRLFKPKKIFQLMDSINRARMRVTEESKGISAGES